MIQWPHETEGASPSAGVGAPAIVHFPAGDRQVIVNWVGQGERESPVKGVVIYPLDVLGVALGAKFGDLTPDERDHFLVGSLEERREKRQAWRGGHIFGEGGAGER